MKIKTILVLFLLSILQVYGQAHKIGQMKNWQLKGFGKSAERMGDLYSAIDYYAEYVKRFPNKIEYVQKLADLYYKSKNYNNAKSLYIKLYNSNHEKYAEALFYYAEILKTELNYDSAKTCFQEFEKIVSGKKEKNLYNYLVEIEIQSCDFALRNLQVIYNIVVFPLNNTINKANLESAPILYNDSTLIYSSMQIDSIPIISSNQEINLPVNRFYAAKLHNNSWQGGYDAPQPFYNVENHNTANGAFSLDKQRFYFTVAKRNWKNKIIGTLYVSHKKNGIWQKPEKLNDLINLKGFTSTQPAIGISYEKNHEVIYFISDRPDGWGGMDIWYTVFDISSQTYKKPINAGGYINTPADEITPFYDNANKTLYFSSNGLPGYGGFDVFKSEGWLVNWTASTNLGLPFNSSFDDIYYSRFKFKDQGFVVSNRDGALYSKNPHCCFDIFEFKTLDTQTTNKVPLIAKNAVENPDDQKTNKNNVEVALDVLEYPDQNKYINPDNQNIIEIQNCLNSLQSTTIQDEKEYHLIRINHPNKEAQNTYILENVYFDYNKSKVSGKSKSLIDTTLYIILKENKDIKVEIGAHTDNIGDEKYNLKLSELRAKSVVDYLISKGIQRERLIPVGYGKSKPLYSPFFIDGKVNPKAQEKNRRIEFKILKNSLLTN